MNYIKTIDVNGVPTQIDYTALANLPDYNALLQRIEALEQQITGATQTLSEV